MARIYDLIKELPDDMKFISLTGTSIKHVTVKDMKEEHVNDMEEGFYKAECKREYGRVTKISIRTIGTKYGVYNQV
jgi:hypothetical protein